MTSPLLREAITAVKANQRVKARTLLRELLAAEPANELAWIWLSEASDEWSERVYALEQALEINPERKAIQAKLTQLKAQGKEDEPKKQGRLAEVIALAGNGRFQEARDSLIKLAEKDQTHIESWLVLSTLVDDIEDKVVALENVLQLQPYHANAQKLLKRRLQGEIDRLTQGRSLEKKRDWKNAIMAYETAVIISPIEGEKEIARRRLEAIGSYYNPIVTTSPGLTLLRLAAGLPVLYGLLVFIHSGMKLLQIPGVACSSGLIVVLGSLLGTAARHSGQYAYWQKLPPFITKSRVVLVFIGFLIAIIPFIILIMNSINRLALYRASLP